MSNTVLMGCWLSIGRKSEYSYAAQDNFVNGMADRGSSKT